MTSNKAFGVWMDKENATIVGREDENGELKVIGTAKRDYLPSNSSEKNENQHEQTLNHKYYKDILSHMQNVDKLHVTGVAEAQEQFIHFLKDTPQYKNTNATDSTMEKTSDESLVQFFNTKL